MLREGKIFSRLCIRYFIAITALSVLTPKLSAIPLPSHIHSIPELEYAVILFDYHQQNYFSALVEYEYAYALNNEIALSPTGKVLKGGMMLSYGMADESRKMFSTLLDEQAEPKVRIAPGTTWLNYFITSRIAPMLINLSNGCKVKFQPIYI